MAASQASLDAEFAQYVQAIQSLDFDVDDDPLDPFYRCLQWGLQHFGDSSPTSVAQQKAKLYPLVEKTFDLFLEDVRYVSDARYLKVCTVYARFLAQQPDNGIHDAIDVFVQLKECQVGLALAVYYEEFASLLEQANKLAEAYAVYQFGLDRPARPRERLTQRFAEFKRRHPSVADDALQTAPKVQATLAQQPSAALTLVPPATEAGKTKPGKREERLFLDTAYYYANGQELSLEERRASMPRYRVTTTNQPPTMPLAAELSQLAIQDAQPEAPLGATEYNVSMAHESAASGGHITPRKLPSTRLVPSPTINTRVAEAEMIAIWSQPLKAPETVERSGNMLLPAPTPNAATRTVHGQPGPTDENQAHVDLVYNTPAAKPSYPLYPAALTDSSDEDDSDDDDVGVMYPMVPKSAHAVHLQPPSKMPIFCDLAGMPPPMIDASDPPVDDAMALSSRSVVASNLPRVPLSARPMTRIDPGPVPGRPLGASAIALKPKSMFSIHRDTSEAEPTPLKGKQSSFSVFRDEVVQLKSMDGSTDASSLQSTEPPVFTPTASFPSTGTMTPAGTHADSLSYAEFHTPSRGFADQTMSTIGPRRTNDSMYSAHVSFGDLGSATQDVYGSSWDDAQPAWPQDSAIDLAESNVFQRSTSTHTPASSVIVSGTAADRSENPDPGVTPPSDHVLPLADADRATKLPASKPEPVLAIAQFLAGTKEYHNMTTQVCNQSTAIEQLCKRRSKRHKKPTRQSFGFGGRLGGFGHDADDLTMNTELLGQTLGMIDLGVDQYTVEHQVGDGGEATVYLVTDLQAVEGMDWDSPDANHRASSPYQAEPMDANAAPLGIYRALKIQTEANPWEFYMLHQVRCRVKDPRVRATVAAPLAYYHFQDEGYLVTPYYDNGTLIDAINAWKQDPLMTRTKGNYSGSMVPRAGASDAGIEEMLAIFLMAELLRAVEALHQVQVVHTDLKPDNVMLRFDTDTSASNDHQDAGSDTRPLVARGKGLGPSSTPFNPLLNGTPGFFHQRWNAQYSPQGADGWREKGVCLIDFGRALDLSLYPGSLSEDPPSTVVQYFEHLQRTLGTPATPATTLPKCSLSVNALPAGKRSSAVASSAQGQRYSTLELHSMIQTRASTPTAAPTASSPFELDYVGLACIAHCLLFGKYLDKVTTRSNAGPSTDVSAAPLGVKPPLPGTSNESLVMPVTPFKRYWQVDLWTALFQFLLNPRTVGPTLLAQHRSASLFDRVHEDPLAATMTPGAASPSGPLTAEHGHQCLALLRAQFEHHLMAHAHQGSKNLKTLLKQLNMRVHELLRHR
ncbi:protein kinase [Dimargaris verticillata]|uniref:Protein kinase n=1 Tax=Dimargaris verticillata TaxID=2761393 RepID=A0A9W8B498_9FUNG|nr:protein kinase [Dimargaris verticillata]